MRKTQFRNCFLQELDEDVVVRLQLRPDHLPLGRILQQPGEPLVSLVFFEEGFSSTVIPLGKGRRVEVGITGYESVAGIESLSKSEASSTTVTVQLAGSGYFCTLESARVEASRHEQFEALIVRHLSRHLEESRLSAACNASHSNQARLARWLLTCADKSQRSSFDMPQKSLAQMLATPRTTVSDLASTMKKKGMIDYSRGCIRILDRQRLEEEACGCYASMSMGWALLAWTSSDGH